MNAKLLKYSICMCIYLLFTNSLLSAGQTLSGEVTTVASDSNGLYSQYKGIAQNFIYAAFAIQVIVMIYNVARKTSKAKKVVIQMVISTAFTGLLLSVI